MKILLTGAKGFTGQHFVEAALQQGHTIVPLQANLCDFSALKSEIENSEFDTVVHLAALSFVGHADSLAFYQVNVIGTLNLLEILLLKKQDIRQILLASSANIYGHCERSPITEKEIPAPVNHYAASKLAMEQLTKNYLDRLPIFYVRPFNYTGVGQTVDFIIPKLVTHFVERAPVIKLGNLHVYREFNDVRFVCEAYLRLLKKAQRGEIFNICSGKFVALETIITMLKELSGHQIKIESHPDFIRTNEIHKLYGSPEKLVKWIGDVSQPTLQETLHWMYQKKCSSSVGVLFDGLTDRNS